MRFVKFKKETNYAVAENNYAQVRRLSSDPCFSLL